MVKTLISHIGIAVTDLEKAVKKFELLLDVVNPETFEVDDQKVKVTIFKIQNEQFPSDVGKIELVAPSASDSPVAKFIQNRGEGLHHICIYVDDINKKLTELKNAGVRLIDETPRQGAEGNLIAFVHPSDMNGVLIELEEKVKK